MLLDGYAGYSTSDSVPGLQRTARLGVTVDWSKGRAKTRTRCLVVKEFGRIAPQSAEPLSADPFRLTLFSDLQRSLRTA